MLIITADDYGATRDTTLRTLSAFNAGAITSASLMVFMEDSEYGAGQALSYSLDIGIHLNFTTPFTGRNMSRSLITAQEEVGSYLLRNKLSQVLFNPILFSQFRLPYSSSVD